MYPMRDTQNSTNFVMPAGRTSFLRDDRGGITILMLVLFVGILLLTGTAIDLGKHESKRADLQSALDRGILAVTSMEASVKEDEVEGMLKQYLAGRAFDEEPSIWSEEAGRPILTVTPDFDSINSRAVTASVSYPMRTTFLRLVGLSTLDVAASSAARQVARDIEISLVLDISGTMRWKKGSNTTVSNNRIAALKPAAVEFLQKITENGTSPYTTVNLIPYAGSVNIGKKAFNLLGGNAHHDYSYCLELDDADYSDYLLPPVKLTGRDQVPHFNYYSVTGDWDWMDWGWCPGPLSEAQWLSNDLSALEDRVNDIQLHDGTATYAAMKWALAMLDPSSRDFVADLADAGGVDTKFKGVRPADWTDVNTAKYIVLMTDGNVNFDARPKNIALDDPKLLTEDLNKLGGSYREQIISVSNGQSKFSKLCTDAKKNPGLRIFTIAFDVDSTSIEDEMRACATPGDFYTADTLNIAATFNQIYANIEKLKLTQ
jgi:Flp pilus assembly protein TadG